MSDETGDKSDEELRDEVTEEVSGAHMIAAFTVTFPREDNDLDEMEATTAQLTVNIDSKTEYVAAQALMEDALDDMADRAEGGGHPALNATAMPLPDGLAEQLMGLAGGPGEADDEEDDSSEGRGFA